MSETQLSIPLFGDGEDRPAAEIVADAFGFKLAYHDTEKGRRYSVQDSVNHGIRVAQGV